MEYSWSSVTGSYAQEAFIVQTCSHTGVQFSRVTRARAQESPLPHLVLEYSLVKCGRSTRTREPPPPFSTGVQSKSSVAGVCEQEVFHLQTHSCTGIQSSQVWSDHAQKMISRTISRTGVQYSSKASTHTTLPIPFPVPFFKFFFLFLCIFLP